MKQDHNLMGPVRLVTKRVAELIGKRKFGDPLADRGTLWELFAGGIARVFQLNHLSSYQGSIRPSLVSFDVIGKQKFLVTKEEGPVGDHRVSPDSAIRLSQL